MPPSAVPLPPAPPRRRRVRRPLTVLAVLVGLLSAVALPASLAVATPSTVTPGSEIEAFAPYQGQKGCEPIARSGVKAFRDLVLEAYPDTRDAGIARSCGVGGTSEHKEGRAWDWRVDTSSATDVEAVEDLFEWLLAEDEHGNEAAMARRLGVMYVIWDSQVWKSYAAGKGWQPYSGASPHTDHVHISFSWAGALKMTSYWTGEVAPVVPSPIVVVSPSPSASPSGSSRPTGSARPSASPSAGPSAGPSAQVRTLVPSPTPSASPVPSASPTPSAVPTPSASAAVRPAQRTFLSGDDRRAVVRSLPGPWRRH